MYVNIGRILAAAGKLIEGGHYAAGHVRLGYDDHDDHGGDGGDYCGDDYGGDCGGGASIFQY